MKNDPKTSWDSFSYTLQMAHNVWMHITAVQEANEAYDKGIYPSMLLQEQFDRVAFKDIVEAITKAQQANSLTALRRATNLASEINDQERFASILGKDPNEVDIYLRQAEVIRNGDPKGFRAIERDNFDFDNYYETGWMPAGGAKILHLWILFYI